MTNTESIAVVTSAAYVDSELSAEFGRLPPSFLPFGHHLLIERQVEQLKKVASRIVLTLPASFVPNKWETEWLASQHVEIIAVPDDLSLGESISYSLTVIGAIGTVYLLHGDTVFVEAPPLTTNSVGVAQSPNVYEWGRLRALGADDQSHVLTGWFSFSSATNLVRALTIARGNFLAALDLYSETLPLTPVHTSGWLDFGHLQTFYKARTQVNTARSFNSLSISNRTVYKTGENLRKLHAEADWFSNIPPPMRLYTPAFLGKEDAGYQLGYEFNPTLHELYVFGALKPAAWERIVAGAYDFLASCRALGKHQQPTQNDDPIRKMATDKTFVRLETWARTSGVNLDAEWRLNGQPVPSLRKIAEHTGGLALRTSPLPSIMHGDLCFPNMFFDFRQELIKVIDPRGSMIDGQNTIFGDSRYDLAKLNHSVEGYDLILAGRYQHRSNAVYDIEFNIPRYGASEFVGAIAREHRVDGQSTGDAGITALTVHLFLSMLPLHADRPDRQKAFLANALRLYQQVDRS